MDPITAGTLTMLIVITGKWIKGEGLQVKYVVFAVFAMLMLMLLEAASPKLSKQVGLLFVIGAALNYGDDIAKRVNSK